MPKFPSRRTLLAGVTAALVSMPVAASSASAETLTPVGQWSAMVQTTIPTSGHVQYRFSPDHTMAIIAGTVTVPGRWFQTSPNTFFFEITQAAKDSSGNLTGFRYAEQNATMQDANDFTSSGTTRDFNLQGQVDDSFQVQITATRVS